MGMSKGKGNGSRDAAVVEVPPKKDFNKGAVTVRSDGKSGRVKVPEVRGEVDPRKASKTDRKLELPSSGKSKPEHHKKKTNHEVSAKGNGKAPLPINKLAKPNLNQLEAKPVDPTKKKKMTINMMEVPAADVGKICYYKEKENTVMAVSDSGYTEIRSSTTVFAAALPQPSFNFTCQFQIKIN